MTKIDEKIANLERIERLLEKEKELDEVQVETLKSAWTLDDMRNIIRNNQLLQLGDKELIFKINYMFEEQTPMIIIDNFYLNEEETNEMVVYVNNTENVGQILMHLPEDVVVNLETLEQQLKMGMKQQGFYAKILKKSMLEFMDYIFYSTPTKEGWVYNLLFRLKKNNHKIMGTFNCLEKDKDTYGLLLEALMLEMHELL